MRVQSDPQNATPAEREALFSLVQPYFAELESMGLDIRERARVVKREAAGLLLANLDTFIEHNNAESKDGFVWLTDFMYHNMSSCKDPDDILATARSMFHGGRVHDALHLWRWLMGTLQSAHERKRDLHAALMHGLLWLGASQRAQPEMVRMPPKAADPICMHCRRVALARDAYSA